MKLFVAICLFGLVAAAAANDLKDELKSETKDDTVSDDGSYAVGPANVKLEYHAPQQYPVQYPLYYPHPYAYPVHPAFWGHPAFGHPAFAHPAFWGHPAFGHPAFYGHPAFWGHPGFHPALGHPSVAAAGLHPAVAAAAAQSAYPYHPYFGGFAEESADIKNKAESKYPLPNPYHPFAQPAAPSFAQQFPGADAARPGTHPLLGGSLNPYAPTAAPLHPYPFPMHTGVKNGPKHPRPFTPLGQYYPGTTSAPWQPGMVPFPGNFGQPTYFPGQKNGDMSGAAPAEAPAADAEAPAADAEAAPAADAEAAPAAQL